LELVKNATKEQAQEVHNYLRGLLKSLIGEDRSNKVQIIYGGSVTDTNCNELIKERDIDGFLVGGASLKEAFGKIVDSHKLRI